MTEMLNLYETCISMMLSLNKRDTATPYPYRLFIYSSSLTSHSEQCNTPELKNRAQRQPILRFDYIIANCIASF